MIKVRVYYDESREADKAEAIVRSVNAIIGACKTKATKGNEGQTRIYMTPKIDKHNII